MTPYSLRVNLGFRPATSRMGFHSCPILQFDWLVNNKLSRIKFYQAQSWNFRMKSRPSGSFLVLNWGQLETMREGSILWFNISRSDRLSFLLWFSSSSARLYSITNRIDWPYKSTDEGYLGSLKGATPCLHPQRENFSIIKNSYDLQTFQPRKASQQKLRQIINLI